MQATAYFRMHLCSFNTIVERWAPLGLEESLCSMKKVSIPFKHSELLMFSIQKESQNIGGNQVVTKNIKDNST